MSVELFLDCVEGDFDMSDKDGYDCDTDRDIGHRTSKNPQAFNCLGRCRRDASVPYFLCFIPFLQKEEFSFPPKITARESRAIRRQKSRQRRERSGHVAQIGSNVTFAIAKESLRVKSVRFAERNPGNVGSVADTLPKLDQTSSFERSGHVAQIGSNGTFVDRTPNVDFFSSRVPEMVCTADYADFVHG